MTTWNPRANELFLKALELRSAGERQEYLDDACAGDAALRAEVEALLEASAHAGDFLESPASGLHLVAANEPPVAERPGTVIGPYKLLEQIGEGGFGVVFMAEQTQPVRRKVALKVLKPGMDTRQVVARFEAERQALAIMDHPNIAKVHDGGATPSGRPYFVMELVKGVPITEFGDQNHLTPRQRLELFVPVCQAVQHAHHKGIIHRDLKPSNILVTMHDTTPVAKIIDFGIAKALGLELTDKTLFTGFAQIVGTPLYMSPEQAGQSGLDIDTRSDIYSLGVLLYELLTGTTPLRREQLTGAAYDEIRRMIREEDPPKPSTRLSESKDTLPSISAQRQMEPAKLTKLVRGELDWIVMKALEKDRNRRYETANAVAMDVQRYLADEPVQAGPPSAWYRFRKFARRNKRALVAVTALAIMLLVAALSFAVSTYLVWTEKSRTQEANLRLKDNLELALQTLDEIYVKVAEERLPRDPARKQEHLELLKKALSFYERFAQQNSTDPDVRKAQAKAYRRAGDIRQLLDQFADAEDNLSRAISLYQSLLAENPGDREVRFGLATAHVNLALAQFRAGRHTESLHNSDVGQSLLEELVAEEPREQGYRHGLAQALNNRGTLLMLERRVPEAQGAYERAADLRSQLVRENADALEFRAGEGQVLMNLGHLHMTAGRLAEAEKILTRAVPIYERLVEQDPTGAKWRRGHGVNYSNLALVLRRMGRKLDADKASCEAIRVQRRLVNDFGTVPEFQADLALSLLNRTDVLGELGRFTEAEESHRESLKYLEPLAKNFPEVPSYRRDQALNYFGLSGLLRSANKQEDAEQGVRRAIAIQEGLTNNHPTVPEYQRDLAKSWHGLGILLGERNRQESAEAAFRKALALQEALLKGWPDIPEYRRMSAETGTDLAHQLGVAGKLPQADQASREAVEQFRTFLAKLPGDVSLRHGLARSLSHRARILRAMKRTDEAEKAEQEAIDLWERLATEVGDVAEHKIRLAEILHEQARLLREAKRLDDAEKPSLRALELWEQLVAEYPAVAHYRRNLGGHLNNRGQLFWSRGDLKRAAEFFEQAIQHQEEARRLDPGSAAAQVFLRNHYSNLADVLTRLGKHAEAARAAEHLPQVVPNESHCRGAAGFLFRCIRLAQKDAALSDADRAAAGGLYTERMRQMFDEAERHRAQPAAASRVPSGFSWSILYYTACGYALLAASSDETERKEHYATRAVEVLQQVVQPANESALLELLKTDRALDPLRKREDFRKLLAELVGKKAAGP